ncbi:hypothetical protein C477_00370 [Haloterrigena salina JCM 13891]|uniref:Uncharacterized protein n=1 Tax=Haloterrigena salina JCM 13891 TaxID=1227488 RepID=M0CPS4_9EURY|nr:hypothetical protein [Haloterrigena salina]ELZ24618.1 hypothetical protein C477_00370 [Haloterrigena salina JCM 13891]
MPATIDDTDGLESLVAELLVRDSDRHVVVLRDETNDIAVYEAPPTPVERDGDVLVDDEGERWVLTHDALECESDGRRLSRVSGRHGLFFAFRSQYETVEIGPN